MRVRAVDGANDWTFGAGQNNYAQGNNAVAYLIGMRLKSFLGDCFFDLGAGLNWFNLLGAKDQTALNLSIGACIMNTPEVVSLQQLIVTVNRLNRNFQVQYVVTTTWSSVANTLQFSPAGAV